MNCKWTSIMLTTDFVGPARLSLVGLSHRRLLRRFTDHSLLRFEQPIFNLRPHSPFSYTLNGCQPLDCPHLLLLLSTIKALSPCYEHLYPNSTTAIKCSYFFIEVRCRPSSTVVCNMLRPYWCTLRHVFKIHRRFI